MITRVHSAPIVVSDQQAAIDFYVGKLGWDIVIDQMMGENYRFVTVSPSPGSAQIALNPEGMLRDRKPGSQSGISLIADDIDKLYEELSAKGVTFTMPPSDMPWGARGAEIVDPDGNTFFVTTDDD